MNGTPQATCAAVRSPPSWPVARWLGAAVLCGGLAGGALAQDEPAPRLRIVGGLAALPTYSRYEEPFWTRELPRLSAGRYGADIVPYDRAGIRGADMLKLVRTGVVPFGTLLLSQVAAQEPELAAPDLAGLNPDMAALSRTLAAYRPSLQAVLRQRHGIELLAVHAYPAQVLYCKGPPVGLAGLAGKRVRTTGASQSDLMRELGAVPEVMRIAEVSDGLRSGRLDCAIASVSPDQAIGLRDLDGHLHATVIDWGLSVFAANGQAWAGLPDDLRALLRREIPRVEAAIWAYARVETAQGVACSTGRADCRGGPTGHLALVPDSSTERMRLREAVGRAVLPAWLRRCGPACGQAWNRSLRVVTGIEAAPGAAR